MIVYTLNILKSRRAVTSPANRHKSTEISLIQAQSGAPWGDLNCCRLTDMSSGFTTRSLWHSPPHVFLKRIRCSSSHFDHFAALLLGSRSAVSHALWVLAIRMNYFSSKSEQHGGDTAFVDVLRDLHHPAGSSRMLQRLFESPCQHKLN